MTNIGREFCLANGSTPKRVCNTKQALYLIREKERGIEGERERARKGERLEIVRE